MIVSVCVGSSCHLRGSYRIISAFKELIDEYRLNDQIELQANFCVGKCQAAVSVKVDDESCIQLNADEAKRYFTDHILKKMMNS